ncbi:hypothetical protein [Erythrobacter litoralis]|nr:hypothetical protein [Erythrobacter litoralis]
MDLNQLFYHHQLALMSAGVVSPDNTSLVDHYARKIRNYRRDSGLAIGGGWQTVRKAAR